jgi:hypothetical protein
MKKFILAIIIVFFTLHQSNAQTIKILFDATKAETAGNADWVIDSDLFNLGFGTGPAVVGGGNESNPQRFPTPLQSTITASTAETYWTGGLSNWAIDCVKRGYSVETLPYNGLITYGNTSNAQDLSNYNIFIVCEPNIQFTATEKTALINFVKNGGGLFMVSDHTVSDRNNDGWDSPAIWNDLLTTNSVQANPFGISFDLANVSPTSTNISSYANDSLLHGPMGNVTSVLWSNGTTMTLSTTANPTVKAAVYNTGASNTGSTGVLVAYARYGLGKVVAIGDSSPCDDGTGDSNDQLYNGYTLDAGGNHQRLLMNATIWLATPGVTTSVVTVNTLFSYFNITPMPFHNNMSIDYSLKNTATLQLSLSNVSGSLVAKWDKGLTTAGEHKENFSIGNLAKGVYLLTINCGKNSFTKEVLVN